EVLAPFERESGENPYTVQADLQELMQNHVGIARDETGLRRALEEIEKLKDRVRRVSVKGNREYNPGWNTALDLKSLLIVSEAAARAGLERRESRGAHTRLDFPQSDAEWERMEVVVRRDGTETKVERRRQPDLPEDLKKIIEEAA
ncbi:MAG: fumarate reductase/succinate dehydrogenase flavoprotein subunit, partial [Acidobacteriota bacterium]